MTTSNPTYLKYTQDHEWIDTRNKTFKVGVTRYAVEQLGDIVHLELPKTGAIFQKGAAFGTIESTKTVSDLYAPVSGKVVQVNTKALENPELLQSDPYGGWLIELEPTSSSDTQELLDADKYNSLTQ